MKAKLIALTNPKIDGVNSAEEFIAYAARVSNPQNQMNNETAPKLLAYLIRNKHWSPLETVSMTFEIETTRDIGRQILRHRSFVFQEFSQRYANAEEMGFTLREARLQDTKNRQNSIDTDDKKLSDKWNAMQEAIINETRAAYSWAIQNGIAKEQARAVLPEGLTMSRLYMTGNLRNFIHYCEVRRDPTTQKEHRELADMIFRELEKEFPSVIKALEKELPALNNTPKLK